MKAWLTDVSLCLPLALPFPLTTSRQENRRFFSGKARKSRRKELHNEKASMPPGHLRVTITTDKPSHTGSCSPVFSISFQRDCSAKDHQTCQESLLAGERDQKKWMEETGKKKRQRKEQKKSIIIPPR